MHEFTEWLKRDRGLRFENYGKLHDWSISEPEAFWGAIWDHFEVNSDGSYDSVLKRADMPGAVWFEGSKVNYAEHCLKAVSGGPEEIAIYAYSETRPPSRISWSELARQVAALSAAMRRLGVGSGDRVVSYMPNLPETVVAMLATISIGAIWSSAAPEFGTSTVIDRFAQIGPKLLFAVDGYRFNGKAFDRSTSVTEIVKNLPTLEHTVWLPYLSPSPPPRAEFLVWDDLLSDLQKGSAPALDFEQVSHDHPIWILFSSGSTGIPKAIVHSHVGMLVTHFCNSLHNDIRSVSRIFYYTTTGWMVFNALVSALLRGASIVTYDGSPTYPAEDVLWRMAEDAGVTSFGTSPTYVEAMRRSGFVPREVCDLSRLETLSVTGSPVQPEVFEWAYRSIKPDIWVHSPCGGTEFCSTILGGAPILPVRAGEIQAPVLGMSACAYDEGGRRVVDQLAELVITRPTPAMPICLWGDRDFARYRDSYFGVYPGVWRHGDFVLFHDDGSSIVRGRSDSTLNRYGVRIGTAEIYRCVERLPEIVDSLVICHGTSAGDRMVLFVKLTASDPGPTEIRARIVAALRNECSPRHVPDRIVLVDEIPYTLSGKKMEVPVRKIFEGVPATRAASRDAMKNPSALDLYVSLATAG